MRYIEILAGYASDISHITTEDNEPVNNLFPNTSSACWAMVSMNIGVPPTGSRLLP